MKKHLSYDDGTYRAEIDIRPATTGDGIRRDFEMYNDMPEDHVLLRAKQLFGTLCAAADVQKLEQKVGTKDNGDPVWTPIKLTPETILDLPGALTALWSLDVFEVNPHWNYGLTADELESIQKKAMQPLLGSAASTAPATKVKSQKIP